MIGYIEGKLFKKKEERILLLINHVGYEILIPGFERKNLETKNIGDDISLYIYHQQTGKNQPW